MMAVNDPSESLTSVVSSDVYRQIDPVGFYSKYTNRGVRPDGRKLHDIRQLEVTDLLENGRKLSSTFDTEGEIISSVRATLGETHIHCSVKAVPTFSDVSFVQEQGSDPLVTVDIELPKQVQPYIYDVHGPCANLNFCVSTTIANVLNSGDVVAREQLRIHELLKNKNEDGTVDRVSDYLQKRKLCWRLEIENYCEEYDGNLIDTSMIAITSALRKGFLPVVLLVFNPTIGDYELCAIDRQMLEKAANGDVKTIKLLHENSHSISTQLNCSFNEENMVHELLSRLGDLGFVGVPLRLVALPYTVTFLQFRDSFLVDPTKEEEKLGVSVSIYCLCGYEGSWRKQLLNLLGCQGITTDIYNNLEQKAVEIINSIAAITY